MDHEKYSRRKSGQIPRFGEWEDANEMPITQYFENARQAGLLRGGDNYNTCSSSSSASSAGFHYNSLHHSSETLKIPSHNLHIPTSRNLYSNTNKTGKSKEKRGLQNRVCDATEQPNVASRTKHHQSDVVRRSRPTPKPVDEDLYKIPPDLLHSSKRKKMPGFFTCLVPCAT